jgi:hypothetical protein
MDKMLTVSVQEINLLGTHNTAMSWIRSQENPDEPVGTFMYGNFHYRVPIHKAC